MEPHDRLATGCSGFHRGIHRGIAGGRVISGWIFATGILGSQVFEPLVRIEGPGGHGFGARFGSQPPGGGLIGLGSKEPTGEADQGLGC